MLQYAQKCVHCHWNIWIQELRIYFNDLNLNVTPRYHWSRTPPLCLLNNRDGAARFERSMFFSTGQTGDVSLCTAIQQQWNCFCYFPVPNASANTFCWCDGMEKRRHSSVCNKTCFANHGHHCFCFAKYLKLQRKQRKKRFKFCALLVSQNVWGWLELVPGFPDIIWASGGFKFMPGLAEIKEMEQRVYRNLSPYAWVCPQHCYVGEKGRKTEHNNFRWPW